MNGRILVAGATGRVGGAAVHRLLEAGFEVRAPEKGEPLLSSGAEVAVGDVREPATLAPALEGCSGVFSALAAGPRRGSAESVEYGGNASLLRAARVECGFVARVLHISDLHFGRPAAFERLESLRGMLPHLKPDAIAVSGDLTQRCTNREFAQASNYLDEIGRFAPCVVVPGNHDIRWLGAVARNLGFAGVFREKAHEFKYSRYKKHISRELSRSLEVAGTPGAIIVGLNTAHGISRGSLTTRLRDLGVIGHVKRRDIEMVREAFESADPEAARIVTIHHNPIRGRISRRHGLANTTQALRALASLGTELILCGHDHQEAIHTTEKPVPGLVISTAGTISNRLRTGHPSTFNLVEIDGHSLRISTYTWQKASNFEPSEEVSFPRRKASRPV